MVTPRARCLAALRTALIGASIGEACSARRVSGEVADPVETQVDVAIDQTGREGPAGAVDRAGGRGLPRRAGMRTYPRDAAFLHEDTMATADLGAVEQRDVGDVEPGHDQLTQGGTSSTPSSARTSVVPASIVTTIDAPWGPATR